MPRNPASRPDETIEYVAAMLRELREIAEARDCDMLAYLISMAEVEAGDIVRGVRSPRVSGGPAGKPRSGA